MEITDDQIKQLRAEAGGYPTNARRICAAVIAENKEAE